jgi:hypothetical protein
MMYINQIREDLKKLARLGANISEAHTSAIFLPTGLIDRSAPSAGSSGDGEATRSIELVAVQSLSQGLSRDCRIQVGGGLLGWVAQHGRSIHVAPFDLDSSTLGLYSDAEAIKSLVAVPIPMPSGESEGRISSPTPAGVLMCDSRRAVSFTKVQIKHLEDLAVQVSRLLFWALVKRDTTSVESSWESFRLKLDQLADAIGAQSIEIIRISVATFAQVERECGVSAAVQQSEQFMRLVQQALPPHFPLVRLPNGDILIALDNMMSAFFQHKLKTLANHLNSGARPFSVSLQGFPARLARAQGFDLDLILQQRPSAAATSTKAAPSVVVGGNRA